MVSPNLAVPCHARPSLRMERDLTNRVCRGGVCASTREAVRYERETAWGGGPMRLNGVREPLSRAAWPGDKSGSLAPYSGAGGLHRHRVWTMRHRPNRQPVEPEWGQRRERFQETGR